MQSTHDTGLYKYVANSKSEKYLPREKTSVSQKFLLEDIRIFIKLAPAWKGKGSVEDEKVLNPESIFHSLLSRWLLFFFNRRQ